MPNRLRRLFAASIWGPGSIPAPAMVYARSRRLYLPIAYGLTIVGGLVASLNGIPTIDSLFPDWIANSVALLFSATGLVSLIGIAFPRLWRMEMYALCMSSGLLTGYSLALFFRVIDPAHDAKGAGFVAVLALLVLVLPLIRIDVLVVEERVRRILAGVAAKEIAI